MCALIKSSRQKSKSMMQKKLSRVIDKKSIACLIDDSVHDLCPDYEICQNNKGA